MEVSSSPASQVSWQSGVRADGCISNYTAALFYSVWGIDGNRIEMQFAATNRSDLLVAAAIWSPAIQYPVRRPSSEIEFASRAARQGHRRILLTSKCHILWNIDDDIGLAWLASSSGADLCPLPASLVELYYPQLGHSRVALGGTGRQWIVASKTELCGDSPTNAISLHAHTLHTQCVFAHTHFNFRAERRFRCFNAGFLVATSRPNAPFAPPVWFCQWFTVVCLLSFAGFGLAAAQVYCLSCLICLKLKIYLWILAGKTHKLFIRDLLSQVNKNIMN